MNSQQTDGKGRPLRILRRLFQSHEEITPSTDLSGQGSPPRAGSGELRKLSAADPEPKRWGREYRGGGSVWKDLAIVAVVIVGGFLLTTQGTLDRLLHGPPPATPNGQVLLISAHTPDIVAVRQTVLPRGYTVRTASNADEGFAGLQRESGQIGFVVIDGDMGGAKRLVAAAKSSCPQARLIVLTGPRQVGDVANRLIDGGIR